MKSICIKINNPKSIEYLLEKLKNIKIDNLFFSYRNFKHYQNIIIHFRGKNDNVFLNKISKLLSYLVIEQFEEQIIYQIIFSEYFYFDKLERFKIQNITIEDLYDDNESIYTRTHILKLLSKNFYEYFHSSHSIILKGFIPFRVKNYIRILSEQIDKSVNKFLIEKEYTEFISLLKKYINTEIPKCDIVHLIYDNSQTIILDQNKNIIKSNENLIKAKYLSDISFSSSDYALNTLLTLLPRKIYIHLAEKPIDDFINTLKLIFENRIVICTL